MDVKQELETLYHEHGGLTPSIVINAAKDEAHPLHDRFTWDDSEAAEKWRIEEARTLIRSVKITIKTEDRTITTPYFVHDSTIHNEPGYIAINLVSDEVTRKRILNRELGAALGALDRALEIAEALNHKETIRTVKSKIEIVREELRA